MKKAKIKCIVLDCGADAVTKQMCNRHYKRSTYITAAERGSKRRPTIAEEFWLNATVTANPEKCWIWKRRIGKNGYGGLRFKGKLVEAHRYSYFLTHGKWPMPMCLHSCDTPACINPNHLRAGNQTDNMDDLSKRGRGRKSRKNSEEQVSRNRVGANA